MRVHRLFAATLASVSGLVIHGAACAQTSGGPAVEADYGDIIVTANKREESLSKVGQTITALTSDALKERKISSLDDIASAVPGLSYAPSAGATPILTLRGIGFNEQSLGVYPSVSSYVDEVPLAFPVMTLHAAFDLERIEVLKGPQGTLFGQNATGGAINFVAAKPTRVETQSQPEGYRCCEAYGRQEIPGEFVVAGRDAAEVLEAAEHGLDPPTILVAAVVILDWALSITTTGDHRDRALFAQGRPDTVGIVAAVGDHPLHADGLADQQVRALHIGRIAGRQDEAEWSPENIDKRVDLRRPATTRDANGIGPRPPFAPPAERWALM